MTVRVHIAAGLAASAVILPFSPMGAGLFFLASVFIDLDHYFDYVFHNGFTDLSISGMFAYHRALSRFWRDPSFINIEVFHTVEFILFLTIVALYTGTSALFFVIGGLLFHITLDLVFLTRHKILHTRAHTLAGYVKRRREMALSGLDPALPYRRAVEMTARGTV